MQEFIIKLNSYLYEEMKIKEQTKTIKDKINYLDCLIKLINDRSLSYAWNQFLELDISSKDLEYILETITPYIIVWRVSTIQNLLGRLLRFKIRGKKFNYNKKPKNKLLKIFEVLYG